MRIARATCVPQADLAIDADDDRRTRLTWLKAFYFSFNAFRESSEADDTSQMQAGFGKYRSRITTITHFVTAYGISELFQNVKQMGRLVIQHTFCTTSVTASVAGAKEGRR
jgi:hypothetical protein